MTLTLEEVALLRHWYNYMAETVTPNADDDALYARLIEAWNPQSDAAEDGGKK